MLQNIAVVVVNGFLPFEFGTVCEVFGVDRSDDGLPRYDFAVVGGEPPPLHALDFTMQPSHGLERLASGPVTLVRPTRSWCFTSQYFSLTTWRVTSLGGAITSLITLNT